MFSLRIHPNRWIVAGLAVLMAVTRFHHEGTAFAFPDASLAVFFLLGWYLGGAALFVGFLLVALAIDSLAVGYGGVGAFCVSPAYGFLVPAYAAIWWAGRCTERHALTLPGSALALLASTTAAYLISEISFFVLSGRTTGLDWRAYGSGMLEHYPVYLGSTLAYVGLVLALLDPWVRQRLTVTSRPATTR